MALKKNQKYDDMTVKKPKPKFYKIVTAIFAVNLKILAYTLNVLLSILLVGIITGAVVGGTFAIYINNYIDATPPVLDAVSSELEKTTMLYYCEYDDKINKTNPQWVELESERLHSSQNRFWAKYRNFPQDLINAFVAIEDKRFFEHAGVDWYRTGAVILDFVKPDSKLQGGSTITQQLIKQMTGDDEQTVQRKIQEILRALNLEKETSKADILENYLNIVNLSQGNYGVQAAANSFFSKDVSELSLLECAALAAIVKSPYKYDPVRNPEENKERRIQVLYNMYEEGYITREKYDELKDQDLVLNRDQNSQPEETIKSYYTDQVVSDVMDALQEKYGITRAQASYRVLSGGLSIYTCMDKEIQETMEYVYMKNDDDFFPKVSEGEIKPQSSMIIMDPKTGDLLGIVGGRGDKVQKGLNRASASPRQPGSSIKPISAYAPALERGLISYGSVTDDSPVIFPKSGSSIKGWPTNYPLGYQGYCSTYYAVQESKNTVAARIVNQLTPEYVYDYLKNRMNFKHLVNNDTLPSGKVVSDVDLSPLALGGMTYGVTVYELTAAYGMLANKGIYCEPRSYVKVLDQHGNVILDNQMPKKDPVISEESAVIMTQMLTRVVDFGTAKSLDMKSKIQVAGKTGTTNDDKDKWFVGYTPYYVCGVWFGYDIPQYLGKFGLSPAISLFNSVMDAVHTNLYERENNSFEIPPTVVTAQYCKDSGMTPGEACKYDVRGGNRIETGYFAKGSEITAECTTHVMVDFCSVTGYVAGPGCPSTKKGSLIRIKDGDRLFPIQVGLPDAQYTYREVPYDYIYPSNTSVPFFANLLPANTYSGTSGSGRPKNSFCVEHNYRMTISPDRRHLVPEETTTEGTTEISTELEAETTTESFTEPIQNVEQETETVRQEEPETTVKELTTEELTTEELTVGELID